MNAITFRLKLIEPVLIANPVTGDENSAAGLGYIPGGVIRGALAQRFTGGKSVFITGHFQNAFFGSTFFLNAYPSSGDKRTLPSPLSWRREFSGGLTSGFITDLACLPEDRWSDDNLKRLGESDVFCHAQSPSPSLSEVEDSEDADAPAIPTTQLCAAERRMDIHIFQNDRRTVREGDSSLFRYEAIAAGESFASCVIAESMDDLNEIAKWLTEDAQFKIGKSRSAGYGLVQITAAERMADWYEFEPIGNTTGRLVVTLLSDAVVRDANGTEATTIQPAVGAQPGAIFARTHIVGGFSQSWGLPLAQSRAISAGSVFVFDDTPVLRETLAQAERAGIGERRIEGFGRIAVNWQGAERIELSSAQTNYGKAPTVTTSQAEVERMIERLWRITLEEGLARASLSPIDPKPNNAQLSRVRMLAREALRLDTPQHVADELGRMRKTARDQFEKARINDVRLWDWISDVATKTEEIESRLRLRGDSPPSIGNVRLPDDKRKRLQREFAMRLIDGVLHYAAKEAN